MKVILKKDVPNLGRAGDEKDVKDGYARNYLIPRDFVLVANAKSRKEKEFLMKMQTIKIQKRKKTAEENAKVINGKTITITVKTGDAGKLFGSVTSVHIQKQLEKDGFLIDKRVIQLEDPIKTLGIFEIPLKLYEGVSCHITLKVADEEGNTTMPQVEEKQPAMVAEATEKEPTAEEPAQ